MVAVWGRRGKNGSRTVVEGGEGLQLQLQLQGEGRDGIGQDGMVGEGQARCETAGATVTVVRAMAGPPLVLAVTADGA